MRTRPAASLVSLALAGAFAAPLIVAPSAAPATAATAAAMPSDFDGDGYADLAIGVPGDNRDAGVVNVLYGSTAGLTAAGDQYWTQDSPGVKGVASRWSADDGLGDRFGSTLATGDFDRDGYADLAIGVPYDDTTWLHRPPGYEWPATGAINVIYGSPSGLTAAGDQYWTRSALSAGGVTWYNVGSQVGAGDFDGDGYWDLVVSTRAIEVSDGGHIATVGAIVLYGGPGGLMPVTATTLAIETDSKGLGQCFSELSMATGDVDGDGLADLAIGVPNATVEGEGDFVFGEVRLFYGDVGGLTSEHSQRWSVTSPGIAEQPEVGGDFGASVAIGDFDGDHYGDLAVGVPEWNIPTYGGAAVVLYGSGAGLTAVGSQLWRQDVPGVPGVGESEDGFGRSLAAGDFDGNGADDLAIGAPGEAPGTNDRNHGGAVTTLYGGGNGLSTARAQSWSQESAGVPGTTEKQDDFGAILASANYGRSFRDDLAIGVPLEKVGNIPGSVYQGTVDVLYGRSGGLSALKTQLWWQDTPGVKGTAQRRDTFGSSLTP